MGRLAQTLGVAGTTMPCITSQKHLREVRDLSFCHVCGCMFGPLDKTDHDHVPPQSCFDKVDRNPPLKLHCHVDCNNVNKLNDEKVGQLIAGRRNEALYPEETHLQIRQFSDYKSRKQYAALENLDIEGAIRRWIGGFHVALYREPLPQSAPFTISTPLPKAMVSEAGLRFSPIPDHHRPFVENIKLNRAARNVDQIVANSGKLKYECVWAHYDNSDRWFCVFALDIYDWIELGDMKNFRARGCVGAYQLSHGRYPNSASTATRIVAKIENNEPLNPFGT